MPLTFQQLEITDEEIQSFDQIYIVACGSAWHVGMAAQYVLEDLARYSGEGGAGIRNSVIEIDAGKPERTGDRSQPVW